MSDIQITQTKSNPGYTSRFGKIIYDTMKHKRLFFVVLPLAILLSLVYSLSLPNVYTCTIKMSPEKLGHSDQEAIAIANTYGVSLTGAALGGIYPRLYPELVNSIEFKTSLLSVKVKRQHDGKVFNYFDYVANHQKYPWWQNLFGTEHIDVVAPVDPFRLTEDQTNVINIINSKIYC